MKLSTHNYQLTTGQKGFTIIEAVVASAVFAFVVTSILGVYLATLRLDSRTRAERAVQQNARFIMEFLSKEVRNGSINYSAYPGGDTFNTENQLWLINQANEFEQIYFSDNNLVLEKTGLGSTNLNSNSVRVTNFKAFAAPDENPLTEDKLTNRQPNVTIILSLASNYGTKPGDVATINLQTTLASRDYPAREP